MKTSLALVLAVMLPLSAAADTGVDAAKIASGGVGEWPSNGRTYAEDHFSPLDSITPQNVAQLGVAWYQDLDTDRGQAATPVVSNGVLYTSTAWSKVVAFDAKTGKLLWSYDPQVPKSTLPKACCDAVNRGVALWGDKVFVGALDGRLIALNAKTGKEVWSTVTVDQSKPYTITVAPRVVKGKVIIGNSGAEYVTRGYVSAYDADTGKLAWRFYTVPHPEFKPDNAASDKILAKLANKTWFGDGWKLGGGGTVWDGMAYDPEADLLYIGTGNGGPQNHELRSQGKGDNLFLASILALKPETGEYVWHYQATPGDTWDYTSTAGLMLTDLMVNGKTRKVIMQAPKNGFFYVLDRVTGELLSADKYTDVTWATGVDLKTGRPIEVPEARYKDKPFTGLPGPLGAHGPQPWAFNPKIGLVYIPVQHAGSIFKKDRDAEFHPGRMYQGIDYEAVVAPDDETTEMIRTYAWGELVAWDPVAKKTRWTARNRFFHNGGVLATAGGLVFQGTNEGHFNAYDGVTGTKLWTYSTGNGIISGPISYSIDGVQYVALLAGYGGGASDAWPVTVDQGRLPGRLLVFKTGAKTDVPAYVKNTPPPIEVGNATSAGDPKKGLRDYTHFCMVCHAASAAGNFNADIRRSSALGSPDLWRSIVHDGMLSENGMVGFSDTLTPARIEDIRAYVLTEARLAEEAAKKKAAASAKKVTQ